MSSVGFTISSIKYLTAVRPILSPGWSTVVKAGLMIVELTEFLDPTTAISSGIFTFSEGEFLMTNSNWEYEPPSFVSNAGDPTLKELTS